MISVPMSKKGAEMVFSSLCFAIASIVLGAVEVSASANGDGSGLGGGTGGPLRGFRGL